MSDPLISRFASPERSSAEQTSQSQKLIDQQRILIEAFNAFPEIVLVLDTNRQIVHANKKLLNLFGLQNIETLLGKRPGEAFQCVHSQDEAAGCGTSIFCRECGAVKAILSAVQGKEDTQECRMTIQSPQGEISLDLRVWSVPIAIDNQAFVVFTIKDIADEKRREALERTFFHDILNEAGILTGYSENAKDGLISDGENPLEQMHKFSKRIVNSIKEQRDLLAAEAGRLAVSVQETHVYGFLSELIKFIQQSKLAKDKKIVLHCSDMTAVIATDLVILNRVITNLIKNALEAVALQETVKVFYEKNNGQHVFFVHNPAVMPQEIQLQMFQRSFSTKGKGRGIGTYSVKLFTEQYLKGKVGFESTPGQGTRFFIQLKDLPKE